LGKQRLDRSIGVEAWVAMAMLMATWRVSDGYGLFGFAGGSCGLLQRAMVEGVAVGAVGVGDPKTRLAVRERAFAGS